jgi:putative hemolysin
MIVIAIVTSLILIGFFSGIETAFLSANKLSIELKRKQGFHAGKTWGAFSDKPARFIGTTLVGFNIALVVYGLLWSNFMQGIWQNQIGSFAWNITNPYLHLIIETAISTIFLLFFELIFKAFFKAKNDTVLSSGFISYIASFFYAAFSWIASFFVSIAEWMLKIIFNVKINKKKEVFTKIDLEYFIQHSKNNSKNNNEENIDEINKELFENALSLREVKLRECLIPRKEIEGVQAHVSIEEVKNKFIHTQLSKLVVYEGNIDNITGYIHQLDLFKNPGTIKDVQLPIPAVPESMSATDLMNKFSKERKSIAWVIDEFGGTAGIVTMEDLLEEIFGDIKDEFDTEEFVEKQLADNEFIFSGRLELDYIEEQYELKFTGKESAETLSGYIVQNNEGIPKLKDRIIIDNYEFDILNVSDTRIETVKLKALK